MPCHTRSHTLLALLFVFSRKHHSALYYSQHLSTVVQISSFVRSLCQGEPRERFFLPPTLVIFANNNFCIQRCHTFSPTLIRICSLLFVSALMVSCCFFIPKWRSHLAWQTGFVRDHATILLVCSSPAQQQRHRSSFEEFDGLLCALVGTHDNRLREEHWRHSGFVCLFCSKLEQSRVGLTGGTGECERMELVFFLSSLVPCCGSGLSADISFDSIQRTGERSSHWKKSKRRMALLFFRAFLSELFVLVCDCERNEEQFAPVLPSSCTAQSELWCKSLPTRRPSAASVVAPAKVDGSLASSPRLRWRGCVPLCAYVLRGGRGRGGEIPFLTSLSARVSCVLFK